jgi:hypothetical protein
MGARIYALFSTDMHEGPRVSIVRTAIGQSHTKFGNGDVYFFCLSFTVKVTGSFTSENTDKWMESGIHTARCLCIIHSHLSPLVLSVSTPGSLAVDVNVSMSTSSTRSGFHCTLERARPNSQISVFQNVTVREKNWKFKAPPCDQH